MFFRLALSVALFGIASGAHAQQQEQLRFTLPDGGDEVRAFALCDQGKLLVANGPIRKVHVWDVANQELLHTVVGIEDERSLNIVWAVTTRPESVWAACGFLKHVVTINARSGKVIKSWPRLDFLSDNDAITRLATSKDGKQIAIGSAEGVITLWDAIAGKETFTFESLETYVSGLRFTNDNRWLISSDDEGALRTWNLEKKHREKRMVLSQKALTGLDLTSDSKIAVVSGFDGVARVVELSSGKVLVAFEQHKGPLHAVAISNDDRWAATGGHFGEIFVWEIETGKQVMKYHDHPGIVKCLGFSPDSTYLFSSSREESGIRARRIRMQNQ